MQRHNTRYASQYRGIAASTENQRDGYCSKHQHQGNQNASQCIGTVWDKVLTTYRRCKMYKGIDTDGHCRHHRARPKCQGHLLDSDGQRTNISCSANAKVGYQYCRSSHNPNLPLFPPKKFRSSVLTRSYWKDEVVKRYDGQDLYNGGDLNLKIPGRFEMDHINELQCFFYALHFVNFRDDKEEVEFVTELIRDEVTNQPQNLCFTEKVTNRAKGSSVTKFLDDSITGHLARGATSTNYLLAGNYEGKPMSRPAMGAITREMGSAIKYCQHRLADQGEIPSLDALSDQLQRLYVHMELGHAEIKKEIIATVYHPSRIQKWLDDGNDIDAYLQ